MKKAINILTPIGLLIIIVFSLNTSLILSKWDLSTGTTIEYTLEKATWTVSLGTNSEQAEGGVLCGLKISPEGVFDIEVISIDSVYGVEFQIDNQTDTSSGSLTFDQFLFEFVNFLYYPSEECERLNNEGFNSQIVKQGPNLFNWFFIEPKEDLWDFFDEVANIAYHETRENYYDYNAYFEGFFERRDNNAIFDMYMYGNFFNETLNSNISFDHNVKFVWEESTGILLGYRYASSFSGNFKGTELEETVEVVCSKSDYALPNFKFFYYSGFISGFEIMIVIFSISSIVVINFLLKKKKK